MKLSILRLIPRRLVRDALLPTERDAAMAAALSKIFAKNPEHPFAKIAAVEFNRLARLYEVEKRRIIARKPKNRRNVERDRRIFAAHAAGKSVKAIALDERLSEGRVSQILSGPRP